MNHVHKGPAELAYDENKKRLRFEGRILMDRVMNEVLAHMTDEFQAALLRGEVLEVGSSREEAREYFKRVARLQLEAGS